MSSLTVFLRQVRSRSMEHQRAMQLLSSAGLAGQMVSVLRQELDSMVRCVYLLTQDHPRRALLIDASVHGEKWSQEGSRAKVTDREMVGWPKISKAGRSRSTNSGVRSFTSRAYTITTTETHSRSFRPRNAKTSSSTAGTTTVARTLVPSALTTLFPIFLACLRRSQKTSSAILRCWKMARCAVSTRSSSFVRPLTECLMGVYSSCDYQ